MRIILLCIFSVALYACSSSYSPSEKMLAYKKDMNTEQARQVLQQVIWGDKVSRGICGSRGFWYDDNAAMEVHADRIVMLAHRRGELLRQHQKKIGEVNVFEKQYYEYAFRFDQLSRINVYDDPRLLPVFPDCNKKDFNKEYRIVDLYIDELNNLKFIVPQKEFDRSMAALSLLLPDVPIYLK